MNTAAPHHTINQEIAVDLAATTDTLFMIDEIVDATALMNSLLSNKDRIALLTTLNAAEARLFQQYTTAHPDVTADVAARELAGRIVDSMWSSPDNELLGGAILMTHVHGGSLFALDADTRRLLETAHLSEYLRTSALLVTGLSFIVSYELGLAHYGDAIRKVLS
jgi:hypothetical protein